MVSNTDIVIASGIGVFSFGSLSYYLWKQCYINILKVRRYYNRTKQLDDPDMVLAPEDVRGQFENMTEKQRKLGAELCVMGYSLSFKSYILREAGKLNLKKLMNEAITGLPQEIMVVNKFYPQHIFSIGYENKTYRETYGYKFAIEHMTADRLLIEPFIKTELIGVPEFYHKKRAKWYQRFVDMMDSITSTDPFVDYSYSSSILFEGDYITAFGVVSYNIDTDKFTMTKPIAICKGGLDTMKAYFAKKMGEKGALAYAFGHFAMLTTIATVGCFLIARHYYKKAEGRQAEVADKTTDIDSMQCLHCGEKKREVIFNPCLHMLYCHDCCTLENSTLDKTKLEKCEK